MSEHKEKMKCPFCENTLTPIGAYGNTDLFKYFCHKCQSDIIYPPQREEQKKEKEDMLTSSNKQIGGHHYLDMPIQPMEYSMANNLDPLQHTIIKYVSRFRAKGGIEDLEKAKHCIEMLIDYEKNKKQS